MCVVLFLLGMLSFHLLKGVCGCKNVVEGNGGATPIEAKVDQKGSSDGGTCSIPCYLGYAGCATDGPTEKYFSDNKTIFPTYEVPRDSSDQLGFLTAKNEITNETECNATSGAGNWNAACPQNDKTAGVMPKMCGRWTPN